MTTTKKKRLILILSTFIAALALSLLFPSNVGKKSVISELSLSEERAIISQQLLGVSLTPTEVTKIYYKGNLLGVIQDDDLIDEARKELEEKYSAALVDNCSLRLDDNIYTLREKTFWIYEEKDTEIVDYLVNKNMFVTEASQIQIIDAEGNVKDTIYVNSLDQFTSALKKYALCFIDEETYTKLENNETIADLTTYGSQNKSIYIEEKLRTTQAGAAIEDIFYDEDSIFTYLCYGKDYTLDYYTVEEYDTIPGVASKNGLTADQVVALNSDLDNVDQTIVPGQQLVVTYFQSPITIVVEQERISKIVTYPGSTTYEVDPTMLSGKTETVVEAKNGYNNVTYTDIYVNGILTSYREESVIVVEEPVAAIVKVGSGVVSYNSGLSFRLPCDNPYICCDMNCYAGHHGVDFQNIRNLYGPIYACEDGVIVARGYEASMGNYYFIDHGNGYVLRYMHMNVTGYFPVGTAVTKGMVIGQIGSTGRSSAPHIHIGIYLNGEMLNPCSPGLLPCGDAINR